MEFSKPPSGMLQKSLSFESVSLMQESSACGEKKDLVLLRNTNLGEPVLRISLVVEQSLANQQTLLMHDVWVRQRPNFMSGQVDIVFGGTLRIPSARFKRVSRKADAMAKKDARSKSSSCSRKPTSWTANFALPTALLQLSRGLQELWRRPRGRIPAFTN